MQFEQMKYKPNRIFNKQEKANEPPPQKNNHILFSRVLPLLLAMLLIWEDKKAILYTFTWDLLLSKRA